MKTSSGNKTVASRKGDSQSIAGMTGLRHPTDATRVIRAVLFDVDGTLYRQAPLRSAMAVELLGLPLQGLREAPRRWRAIRAYRGAQESLRLGATAESPAVAQIATAARRSGLSEASVEALIQEWMFTRPLKYLRWCRAQGLDELLLLLDRAGVAAGVLSDYPAHDKLAALGLRGRFWPILSSTDPEIAALKPHPRGFLRAASLWDLRPSDVLVVGDRPDADGAGAAAAGMSCAIVGRHGNAGGSQVPMIRVSSLMRLCHVLDGRS
jgi:HAD superfamily hydrolase (TIGR01549 family)